MSSRVVRAFTRARPSTLRIPLQRRGYADPVSDKIKLTLALPHQVGASQRCTFYALYSRELVCFLDSWHPLVPIVNIQIYRCVRYPPPSLLWASRSPGLSWPKYELRVQVNIPAESGEMGVLANHVPSIEQLKPGLVEIIEESGGSKQFFCKWAKGKLKNGWRMETCIRREMIRMAAR